MEIKERTGLEMYRTARSGLIKSLGINTLGFMFPFVVARAVTYDQPDSIIYSTVAGLLGTCATLFMTIDSLFTNSYDMKKAKKRMEDEERV